MPFGFAGLPFRSLFAKVFTASNVSLCSTFFIFAHYCDKNNHYCDKNESNDDRDEMDLHNKSNNHHHNIRRRVFTLMQYSCWDRRHWHRLQLLMKDDGRRDNHLIKMSLRKPVSWHSLYSPKLLKCPFRVQALIGCCKSYVVIRVLLLSCRSVADKFTHAISF